MDEKKIGRIGRKKRMIWKFGIGKRIGEKEKNEILEVKECDEIEGKKKGNVRINIEK